MIFFNKKLLTCIHKKPTRVNMTLKIRNKEPFFQLASAGAFCVTISLL